MDVRVFTRLVARFTVAVFPGLRVVAREVLWALRLVLAIAINLAEPAAATQGWGSCWSSLGGAPRTDRLAPGLREKRHGRYLDSMHGPQIRRRRLPLDEELRV
jgi:hypothetical protein